MNNNLLIFGGSGYLGNALVDELRLRYPSTNIISFARGEANQKRLKDKHPNVDIFIGNIQNQKDVNVVFREYQPHLVVIASALKHIDICQEFPNECISTNITGTQNVLNAIKDIKKKPVSVCFVSTDKAVNPVNIYGTSKFLCEQLINEANDEQEDTNFYSVRYGNVLNSTGSLFPVLKGQVKNKILKISDPNMTRFSLSVEQAVIAITAGITGRLKGVIVPLNLKSFRLGDVIEVFSEKYKFKVDIIGAKTYEKMDEVLMQVGDKYDQIGNYAVIHPYGCYDLKKEYNSANNLMSYSELKGLIDAYI